MIYFDVTKVSAQKHRSGLVRVSERLRAELAVLPGVGTTPVAWHPRRGAWVLAGSRQPVELRADDWLLTPELFCEEERPGLGAWLAENGRRAAAVFHDAIPLRFPEITWPQSVARHPGYMRLLADFGRVFAVSEASARELTEYWARVEVSCASRVAAVALGADGHGGARITAAPDRARSRAVVMVGIVEPRKNQVAVLDAVEALAAEGIDANVSFIGRTNPHFGKPALRRIKELAKAGHAVAHHESLDDRGVVALIAAARFSILPSRAEGCGLPVLEALWAGLPVLATALPSIQESAAGGGCVLVAPDDAQALVDGMRRMLTDDALIRRLQAEAVARALPSWRQTAAAIAAGLK